MRGGLAACCRPCWSWSPSSSASRGRWRPRSIDANSRRRRSGRRSSDRTCCCTGGHRTISRRADRPTGSPMPGRCRSRSSSISYGRPSYCWRAGCRTGAGGWYRARWAYFARIYLAIPGEPVLDLLRSHLAVVGAGGRRHRRLALRGVWRQDARQHFPRCHRDRRGRRIDRDSRRQRVRGGLAAVRSRAWRRSGDRRSPVGARFRCPSNPDSRPHGVDRQALVRMVPVALSSDPARRALVPRKGRGDSGGGGRFARDRGRELSVPGESGAPRVVRKGTREGDACRSRGGDAGHGAAR